MICPHCSSEKVAPECHFKVQYASVGGLKDDVAISWHCEGCTLRFYLFRSECRSELKRLIEEWLSTDNEERKQLAEIAASINCKIVGGETGVLCDIP